MENRALQVPKPKFTRGFSRASSSLRRRNTHDTSPQDSSWLTGCEFERPGHVRSDRENGERLYLRGTVKERTLHSVHVRRCYKLFVCF
ncbi:hypothetical protein VTO73DRAFT_760 [Trametes versicolor]